MEEGRNGPYLPSGYLEYYRVDAHSAVLKIVGARSVLGRRSKLERWFFYLVVFLALNGILLRATSFRGHLVTSLAFPGTWQAISSRPVRGRRPSMATGPARVPLPTEARFRANGNHVVERGLLQVNMESRLHPIYKLIRDARNAWDVKLEGQSESLEEAVVEYRRRYGRQPPKGFDRWWKYVV